MISWCSDCKEDSSPVISSPRRARRCFGLRGDGGSASIETALSLTVLFGLVFWLFELSLFVYTWAVLNDAAHEGVRYAIAHGADSSNCSGPTVGCGDLTGTKVIAAVQKITVNSFQSVPTTNIFATYPDSSSQPGSLVKVSIVYPYVPFFKSLGFAPTATISAQGRIVF